ncbi:hypothetical protein [Burkholderia orbicola]|uniref:hypothetical protein n=1 Tax=Burkholderia orbicola TaxID=2978683 RepID=UPI002FE3099F
MSAAELSVHNESRRALLLAFDVPSLARAAAMNAWRRGVAGASGFDDGVKTREKCSARGFFIGRGHMQWPGSAARDVLPCTENGAM